MRLTEHFSVAEVRCPDGCGLEQEIRAVLLAGLEELRRLAGGLPIFVTSGARCLSYNRSIGSADTSQHIVCRAADVWCRHRTPAQLAELAKQVGVFAQGGIGVYETFIHVDCRPDGPARW